MLWDILLQKEIHDRERIPVGLLQTAVGGTPVKSWCSEETVTALGYDAAEIEECRQKGYPEATIKAEEERELWWRKEALKESGVDCATDSKGSFCIPGFFENTVLDQFYGGLRFTKPLCWMKKMNRKKEKLFFISVL